MATTRARWRGQASGAGSAIRHSHLAAKSNRPKLPVASAVAYVSAPPDLKKWRRWPATVSKQGGYSVVLVGSGDVVLRGGYVGRPAGRFASRRGCRRASSGGRRVVDRHAREPRSEDAPGGAAFARRGKPFRGWFPPARAWSHACGPTEQSPRDDAPRCRRANGSPGCRQPGSKSEAIEWPIGNRRL